MALFPPITMPYLFEDPFITTSAHLHQLWHEFPTSSVFEGGDVRITALQLRLALTDRLAFIATKDGYVDFRPELNLLDSQTGFMNFTAGLKYALIDWRDKQFIVTPSLRVELSQGSPDILSGQGKGAWIPGVSAGIGRGRFHLIGDVGVRLPVDGKGGKHVFLLQPTS